LNLWDKFARGVVATLILAGARPIFLMTMGQFQKEF
jgi:hypothetical protein